MSDRDLSPWPPTKIQVVGAVVGLVIALASVTEGPAGAAVLRVVGYPVACAAIVRWVPILRARWRMWFVTHQAGMLAIVVGWVLTERWFGVVVNGAWFLIAGLWWASHQRAARAPAH